MEGTEPLCKHQQHAQKPRRPEEQDGRGGGAEPCCFPPLEHPHMLKAAHETHEHQKISG